MGRKPKPPSATPRQIKLLLIKAMEVQLHTGQVTMMMAIAEYDNSSAQRYIQYCVQRRSLSPEELAQEQNKLRQPRPYWNK